jgi:hypothetical protein
MIIQGRLMYLVYELKNSLIQSLHSENTSQFSDLLQNWLRSKKSSYISNIFQLVNKIDASMERNVENILTSTDKTKALKHKLKIWNR